MSTERPAFELESYEDKTLPEGKRLLTEEDLVGHNIKAMVTYPNGRLSYRASLVIVTETRCWLVLDTTESYSCEEKASINVRQCHSSGYSRNIAPQAETLHDYLDASDMFHHGLISSAQRDALLEIEAAAESKKKQEKAVELRKELAKLEGGAA